MVVASSNGRETVFLKNGEVEEIGSHKHAVGFNTGRKDIIDIRQQNEELGIYSPAQIDFFIMAEQTAGVLVADSIQPLRLSTLYRSGDFSFVPVSFHPKGSIELKTQQTDSKENDRVKDDALALKVSMGDEVADVTLLYREGFLPTVHEIELSQASRDYETGMAGALDEGDNGDDTEPVGEPANL